MLGNHFNEHVIDRKNPQKISVLYQHLYPESSERVCGNTYYVNLYRGQQILQFKQVIFYI